MTITPTSPGRPSSIISTECLAASAGVAARAGRVWRAQSLRVPPSPAGHQLHVVAHRSRACRPLISTASETEAAVDRLKPARACRGDGALRRGGGHDTAGTAIDRGHPRTPPGGRKKRPSCSPRLLLEPPFLRWSPRRPQAVGANQGVPFTAPCATPFVHLDPQARTIGHGDAALLDDLAFLDEALPEREPLDPVPLQDQEVRDGRADVGRGHGPDGRDTQWGATERSRCGPCRRSCALREARRTSGCRA